MRTFSNFQICNSDLFINIPMTYNLKFVFFHFILQISIFHLQKKVCGVFLEWSFELSKFKIQKVIKNVFLNGCED